MKRIYTAMLSSVFSVTLFAALLSFQTSCWWYHYQPELPKALRK